MKQIELEPRHHSQLYEVKPMSRWWLVPPIIHALISAYALGFTDLLSWTPLVSGFLLGIGTVLVFPRFWLSRATETSSREPERSDT